MKNIKSFILLLFTTLSISIFASERDVQYLHQEFYTSDGFISQNTFIFDYDPKLDEEIEDITELTAIDHLAIFKTNASLERKPSNNEFQVLTEKLAEINVPVIVNELAEIDLGNKPTKTEIKLGLTLTTYRGATSSVIWFTTPGVDPMMAAGVVAISSITTFIHSTFGRTLNKLFAKDYFSQAPKEVSARSVLIRRTMYGAVIGELMRIGAQGMPALMNPKTHIDIATNLLSSGLGQNLLSNSVYKNIQKTNPHIVMKFNFYLSLIASPLSMLDLASGDNIPVLLSIGFFHLKVTSVGLLAFYVGLKKLVDKNPTVVIRGVEKTDLFFITAKEKIISNWLGTKKSLQQLCSRPLKI